MPDAPPNKPQPTDTLSLAIGETLKQVNSLILPSQSLFIIEPIVLNKFKETILEKGEDVIFVIKQSKLHNLLTPDVILVTNKKIVIIEPSMFKFLNAKSMAIKESNNIQYTKINDLTIDRGLVLRSIEMKIAGSDPIFIEGLRRADAELFNKFVQMVIEYLEEVHV